MPEPPLVSLVTPCLNPGARLERCLASVRRQTHPDVEHIVVDGGSVDGTVERLRAADVRWVSEPDRGQAHALNKGFALARGSIVGWINADDRLTPWAVQQAVDALRRDPAAGWVYAPVAVFEGAARYVIRPPRRLARRHFRAENPIPQPGSFYHRAALDAVGALDEARHYGMDLDLFVRLVDAGFTGRRARKIGAVFEVHPGSKSGSAPLHAFVTDQAAAFARRGWHRSAVGLHGRALALEAADGPDVDPDRLEAGLATASSGDDEDAVRAACAYAEAAVVGLKAGHIAAVRWLRPEVWRTPEARARLWVAARSFGWKLAAR